MKIKYECKSIGQICEQQSKIESKELKGTLGLLSAEHVGLLLEGATKAFATTPGGTCLEGSLIGELWKYKEPKAATSFFLGYVQTASMQSLTHFEGEATTHSLVDPFEGKVENVGVEWAPTLTMSKAIELKP